MPMTTKGIKGGIPAKRSSDNVTGAGIVDSCSDGKPSVGATTSTQSPASLNQPKMPSTVATFSGSESNASNQK